MGISMVSLGDGKVQLMHSFYNVSIGINEERIRVLTVNLFHIPGKVSRGR